MTAMANIKEIESINRKQSFDNTSVNIKSKTNTNVLLQPA